MTDPETPCVLPLPGNEWLAHALARGLGAVIGRMALRRFPDGETWLRVLTPVAGRDVIVAATLDRPNDKLVALHHLACTLRELGARRVLLAAPYLAYMRQDRAFHDGEAVTARHNARWLSDLFDGLVTVDPHLHRIHALAEVYTIPAIAVPSAPLIAEWVRREVPGALLVGPDSESEQWVADVARRANVPHVVLEKTRHGDRDVDIAFARLDAWRSRTPVLVDDIISTGRTLVAAVRGLRERGLPPAWCVGVHALFAPGAFEELRASGAARVVTCNTIVHASNRIDVVPAMESAIRGLMRPA